MDLDTMLESIPNTGEGVIPSDSASAGLESSGDGVVPTPAPEVTDQNTGDLEQVEETQTTEETTESDSLVEKIKAASVDQEGDSAVIKEMRGLLRERLDKLPQQGEPVLSADQEEAIALVNELYSFDIANDQPTTRGFIDKLASKNVDLVNQVVFDAINVPIQNPEINGWTVGHELLKRIGLDPMRLEELRQFSRGEIQLPSYGDQVEIPEFIPQEYHEAYKAMNPVSRADVDTYIQSVKQDHKVTAIQMLQDKNRVLELDKQEQSRVANEKSIFAQDVSTEVDSQLVTTYTGVLDAIKENPVYTSIKVSAIPQMDIMMKESLISQINALGEGNTVLRNRAVKYFTDIGVPIDTEKVSGLLNDIQTNTEIAVKAEKLGKIQNKDYSNHSQQALSRRSIAIAKTIALANDYFSQALSKLSQSKLPNDIQVDETDPILNGTALKTEQKRTNGALTEEQLNDLVLGTAEGIRKGNS